LNAFKTIIFIFLGVLLLTECGEKKGEKKTKVAGNNPPVINELAILPLNPTVKSEISLRIISSDKDNDPITYQVHWFVNRTKIGEGMSFRYEGIKKGDKIYAEVTPYDGKAWGKPKRSEEIVIANTRPRILSTTIIPGSLYVTTPQVVVNATVQDPDRDSINLIVHWLVKNKLIPDTSNTLKLKEFSLKKNDVITGTAFAYDGESLSEPFPFELVIANAPPTFRTKTDSIKCRPDSIYYPLPIFDPDQDPLTFELLSAPEGIKIDKEKGIIYGGVKDTSSFEVEVRATDSDGAYLEARFTITSPSTK